MSVRGSAPELIHAADGGALHFIVDPSGDWVTVYVSSYAGPAIKLRMSYGDYTVFVADNYELSRIWREGRKA